MVIRAMPGNPDSAVVIHLVDWRDTTEPLDITLEDRRFFAQGALAVTLLRPGEKGVALKGTTQSGRTSLRLPALRPWGMLVVSVKQNK